MEQYAEDVQAVIDTLQKVQVPATYENMNRMLASIQALIKIRDGLKSESLKNDTEGIQNAGK